MSHNVIHELAGAFDHLHALRMLVQTAQACIHSRLSPSTGQQWNAVQMVQSWIKKGVGPPYYRPGHQIRYQRREVLKWFVEHTGPHARCGSECGRGVPSAGTSRKSRSSSTVLRRRHNKDLVTRAVNARCSSRLGGTAPDADADQRVEDQ
jgi:hypothetical protein